MSLRAQGIAVRFAGKTAPVLDGVDLEVPAGKTLAIVGPSGAGKTTLLRALAGLTPISAGSIEVDGRRVDGLPPQRRRIALVFSDDALVPTLSLRANLALGLRPGARGGGADAVAEAARGLHVADHLDRRPREVSSGERQRAAIARALLSEPRALLLDEPLAHVDPSLRRQLRDELVRVRERFAGPIVYVTHDHVEAMNAGDELAVLIGGAIEDRGTPQRVFDAPRTVAVARFLGQPAMNVFPSEGGMVGVRPEHVRVTAGEGRMQGEVVRYEAGGVEGFVYVRTPLGEIVARVGRAEALPVGTTVALTYAAADERRFDARGNGPPS